MSRRVSLRKHNCKRICKAFGSHLWYKWVDPLSQLNFSQFSITIKSKHYSFWLWGTQVHVPLEWYWREIEDWELQSLVTEWKLAHRVD
jgi:hypothetical protein